MGGRGWGSWIWRGGGFSMWSSGKGGLELRFVLRGAGTLVLRGGEQWFGRARGDAP